MPLSGDSLIFDECPKESCINTFIYIESHMIYKYIKFNVFYNHCGESEGGAYLSERNMNMGGDFFVITFEL